MKKSILFVLLVNVQFLMSQESVKNVPNIIWVMAEDISLDLSCYGTKAVRTPNLDQMAAGGMRFNNCFVTNPICSPSRSAMILGTHQQKSNTHNHRSNRDVVLPKPFVPFTQLLKDAGYTTILGHKDVKGKGRKIDVNFKHTPLGTWDGEANFGIYDKYDEFLPEDAPFFSQITLNVTHRGDWWEEVRAQSKHPVNPDEVGLPPYLADDPIIRLDWAKYLDQIEYMDAEIGLLFSELERKGLADNTVVIFIGDNGRCNIRGKGYLHDSGLRIPLLVKWPKAIKKGQIDDRIVSSTDITATILDLANVEIPDFMTGKSFLDKDFNRTEVFASRDLWDEIPEKSKAITTDRFKYIRNFKPEIPWDAHQAYLEFYRPAVHVMRSLIEQGKLNKNESLFFGLKPIEELYDLEKDPFELNNLVLDVEYADILKKMRQQTLDYNMAYKPVEDIYDPVHAESIDVFEWVKNKKPKAYKRMLAGEEIGFHKMLNEYKATNN
ncbi:MAG: sulfatase [Maribacter sp.]